MVLQQRTRTTWPNFTHHAPFKVFTVLRAHNFAIYTHHAPFKVVTVLHQCTQFAQNTRTTRPSKLSQPFTSVHNLANIPPPRALQSCHGLAPMYTICPKYPHHAPFKVVTALHQCTHFAQNTCTTRPSKLSRPYTSVHNLANIPAPRALQSCHGLTPMCAIWPTYPHQRPSKLSRPYTNVHNVAKIPTPRALQRCHGLAPMYTI